VLSLGSINLDIQVRAESFPASSETLSGTDYLRASGGKGANAALIAARLGAEVRLFGRVGDDAFADLALAGLREDAIDLSGVQQIPGQSTGTALIVVRADGDKSIVLAPNANQHWEPGAEQAIAHSIRDCGAGSVLATDLEVPVDVVRAALKASRDSGHSTLLDPSPGDCMQADLYGLCDFITPNPREAERLTGIAVKDEEAALRAGRELLKRGARHACMKLGDGGAALVSREDEWVARAPKVRVVDKTGAGDAFAGALAVALLERRAPREALRFAVLASTYAVTRYGSQAAYPRRAELERFAREAAQ
jgi:ribokinase